MIFSNLQIVADDAIGAVIDNLSESKEPWYWFVHLFDLHDCQNIRRPRHLINQMRKLPRRVLAKASGIKLAHRFNYDLTLMHLDEQLGKIIRRLEEIGQFENTIFAVTGDHGLAYASSPRTKLHISLRTHAEDIEVPFIVGNCDKTLSETALMDSRDMAVTILDAVGLPPHESFQGVSALAGGRDVVVTECAGSGNADLEHKVLYFTVTTQAHRMMAELHGGALRYRELYDRSEDPMELCNLVDVAGHEPILEAMARHLWNERSEILSYRGYDPASVAAKRPSPV